MKRSHRRSNGLQSSSFDMNSKFKLRNGSSHKEGLPLAIKRYKSTPGNNSQYFELHFLDKHALSLNCRARVA